MTVDAQSFTLNELMALSDQSPPNQVMIGFLFAKTHQQRVELVEKAIDWVVLEFLKTRQHRQGDDEDRLTVDIVVNLKAMGIQASHDTDYGGHCDIVIESRDNFLWMAEAKIHGSYDWDFKGLQQLSTRYSTGMPGQDNGALILYCFGKNAKSVMERWSDHLIASKSDLTLTTPPDNVLHRVSVHDHPNTGLPFRVRHLPVPLNFDPQDKS